MPAADRPTTSPWPPSLTLVANTAIVTSASPVAMGVISGPASAAVTPRSASRNSRCLGESCGSRWSRRRTASAPVSMAAALPLFLACRSTAAPASSATRAVASREPSSTTTTKSASGSVAAPVTVSPTRSASLYAGMTTATCGIWLVAGKYRRVGADGEDRVEPGHLENLHDRWTRRGKLKLAAPLTCLAQARQQDIHASGVAELHARHVDDDPGRRGGVDDDCGKLAVQPRSGIKVDFSRCDHDRVISLRST